MVMIVFNQHLDTTVHRHTSLLRENITGVWFMNVPPHNFGNVELDNTASTWNQKINAGNEKEEYTRKHGICLPPLLPCMNEMSDIAA